LFFEHVEEGGLAAADVALDGEAVLGGLGLGVGNNWLWSLSVVSRYHGNYKFKLPLPPKQTIIL